MKRLSLLLPLVCLAALGCAKKEEVAPAPSPAPMKMNGQNVPSEGAHYMQQMGGQQAPNGGR